MTTKQPTTLLKHGLCPRQCWMMWLQLSKEQCWLQFPRQFTHRRWSPVPEINNQAVSWPGGEPSTLESWVRRPKHSITEPQYLVHVAVMPDTTAGQEWSTCWSKTSRLALALTTGAVEPSACWNTCCNTQCRISDSDAAHTHTTSSTRLQCHTNSSKFHATKQSPHGVFSQLRLAVRKQPSKR